MSKIIVRIKQFYKVFLLLFLIILLSSCNEKIETKSYFTVTIDSNNGSEVVNKKIEDGKLVEMPLQPEKENYEFIGWYVDGEEFDFSKSIDKDITLVAKFLIDEDYANSYKVSYVVDGNIYRSVTVLEDRCAVKYFPTNKRGYSFEGWRLDENSTELYDFKKEVKSDLVLYAYFKADLIEISFDVNGKIETKIVEYGTKLDVPEKPILEGKEFCCWYLGEEEFNFDTIIDSPITLVAFFKRASGVACIVNYEFGYDCYKTKNDFKLAYYTDFYNFLLMKDYDFSVYNITSLDDFLVFMDTFKYGTTNEMAAIGYAFKDYYLSPNFGGKLENQSPDRFVGYMYQQGKYIDFFKHMETFFEYWRTDEGCSQGDPFKNDFYADPWASLVDTAKFFFFDGDTLQTRNNGIYSWFNSARVKYALDHIPGVGYVRLKTVEEIEEYIELPNDVIREGYTFDGWFDSEIGGNKILKVNESMTVYAHWTKN